MDNITRPNGDYSNFEQRQFNRCHQESTPDPQHTNSICPGELSTKSGGANRPGESVVGNTALSDRTIKNHDCQPISNSGSVEKTNVESEEASALPDQNNASLFTQSALPADSILYQSRNDFSSLITCFNFSMLQQQKSPKQKSPTSSRIDMTSRQEQEVKTPLESVTRSACPPPTPTLIHTHNNVSLIKHAGIQAKNNNCSMAAFFMALSNNGLLERLMFEIKDKIINLKLAAKKQQSNSLEDLLAICKNFHFDEETNGYIADEGLNRIRTLYQLNDGQPGTPLDLPEIIAAILNHIYDYPEFEADPSRNLLNLENSKSSLKHKISWIDAGDGFIITHKSNKKITKLTDGIAQLEAPNDLTMAEMPKGAPPPNSSKFIEFHSEYKRGEELVIKCTDVFDSDKRNFTSKRFEYFGDKVNKSRTTEVQLEEHPCGDIFVRSSATSFINPRGQKIFVNHVLSGFNIDEPDSGKITTTISRMATTVEELIINSLNGTRDQLGLDESAFKQLLPDSDKKQHPEVLFVTIPNFGPEFRADIQWWKDVAIPTTDNKQKKIFGVSALVSIVRGHFLAWNIDGKVLNYADSMGHSENGEIIPLVVKMPITGAEAALQAAEVDSESKFDAYCSAMRRVAKLGQSAALVILKNKPLS